MMSVRVLFLVAGVLLCRFASAFRVPAASSVLHMQDRESVSPASMSRRRLLRTGAGVSFVLAKKPAIAADREEGSASWMEREIAPDPLLEAKRRLDADFEQRYGRKSAYARALVAPAKTKNLPIDQVLDIISEDFVDRQYFVILSVLFWLIIFRIVTECEAVLTRLAGCRLREI